jgi:hypothetical protein
MKTDRTVAPKNNCTKNLPVQPELKLNGLSANRFNSESLV